MIISNCLTMPSNRLTNTERPSSIRALRVNKALVSTNNNSSSALSNNSSDNTRLLESKVGKFLNLSILYCTNSNNKLDLSKELLNRLLSISRLIIPILEPSKLS